MKILQVLCFVSLLAFTKPPAHSPTPETHVPPIIEVPPPAPVPTPAPTPIFIGVTLRPEWIPRLDVVISGMVRDKDRYLGVQRMRPNGMPWYFVGGIHERESSRNFNCHLHEGSPLIHRTAYIPKNRPPPPANPPFSWLQSCEDALYVLKHEDQVQWGRVDASLYALELYNGLGYRNYHPEVKTPYLYSGTTEYTRGKYVADGRFSSTAVDKQAGIAALWQRLIERGLL